MYIFDTEELLSLRDQFRVSDHALREAHKEGLRAKDILHVVFNGEIVERYPARRRVLVVGLAEQVPIPVHVVCDYADECVLVVVTVYIPNRPDWLTEQVRG